MEVQTPRATMRIVRAASALILAVCRPSSVVCAAGTRAPCHRTSHWVREGAVRLEAAAR